MPLPVEVDGSEHSWWAGLRLPVIAATLAVSAAIAPLNRIANEASHQQQDELAPPTHAGTFYETRPTYVVYRWNIDQSEQAFGLHGPPDDDQTNQRVL